MISMFCQRSSATGFHQLADQGVGVQEVGGQEQLGLVSNLLEEEGHRLVEGVALGQQQEAVELLVLCAVELELNHLGAVEAGEIQLGCMLEDLGAALAFGVAQDPVAVVEVAVELHVADGQEAVEPGVGDSLHRLVEAGASDPLLEAPPLLGHRKRKGLAADQSHIAFLDDRVDAIGP